MISVKDLSFSYGSKPVLNNISLDIKGGNIYGLLGENGVGKTTLLTLLAGLKKPLKGSIDTDGRTPMDRQPSLRAEQFYLPDEVEAPHQRAQDFGQETGALWPLFNLGKYLTLLQEFEVDARQRMDSMSSGQLKKTWIAFGLACNARHYFLDEPTNGLDIPSKAQFRSAITRHVAEDAAVVISTHQVRDLENIIDPIIILDTRDVLLQASLAEISEKLYFDYSTDLKPDALYLEQVPGGTIQVYPNSTGEESKVNMEALFNTVYKHKDLIKTMFKK
jgi:ABC-2 type transport system ATP-binding protein